MALAQTIGRMEGWKYTPLFAVDQKDWSAGRLTLNSTRTTHDATAPWAYAFDNPGDRHIADMIVAGAKLSRRLILGDTPKEIDSDIRFDFENGEANGIVSIQATGEYPLTLLEHLSLKGARAGMLQSVQVDAGATLTHIRIIESDDASVLFAPVHVRVAKGGTYRQIMLSRGSATARLTTQIELDADTAHADMRAVHLLTDERHVDQFIVMKHNAPHCTSRQNVRYVVNGEARAAFQGKIMVARDAQKTEAYQLCRSLLLSDAAQMNTKPELEIFADDVKCSHGATTGALDERALFYMQSRGVTRAEAQALLMQAFIDDALADLVLPENVKAAMTDFLK